MKPHEKANQRTVWITDFFEGVVKDMFEGAEFSEDDEPGDVIVQNHTVVEVKNSHSCHPFTIPTEQFEENLERLSFLFGELFYVLASYNNRDKRKASQERKILTKGCRTEKDMKFILAMNTKDFFFVHPDLIQVLMKKLGIIQNRKVRWGRPSIVLKRISLLHKFKDDPGSILKELGLSSRKWEINKSGIAIPFSGDGELPIVMEIPVTEIVPSKDDSLSRFLKKEIINPKPGRIL